MSSLVRHSSVSRPSFSHPSVGILSTLAFAAALHVACDDGDGGGGAGGGTMAGGAGTAGAAGQSGGGNGGGGGSGTAVAPDPLKDCGQAQSPNVPALQLTEIAKDLDSPVYLTQPAGESERLFVVEKPGAIRIISGGELVEEPFLTIDAVSERGGEMGLLGLAFHPEYESNGRFYVYYSTLTGGSAHTSRIAEYTVSDESPDRADPGSERVLLEVRQPEDNHNGGALEFGRDGLLYIGLGDGGGGGDQHGAIGNGQNLDTLLGKILRIDVDGTGAGELGAYAIPAGNLDQAGARPEIWSYGLRNPWRYSFDACTGDMYIADVGQTALEEVNFEPWATSGLNYGWRLMEGTRCYSPETGCDASTQGLVQPVATYGRNIGQSITGGYVYRGPSIPELRGTYLYADYASAAFFALRMEDGDVALEQTNISDNLNPGRAIDNISSFGQDSAGELYVLSINGSVFRITPE